MNYQPNPQADESARTVLEALRAYGLPARINIALTYPKQEVLDRAAKLEKDHAELVEWLTAKITECLGSGSDHTKGRLMAYEMVLNKITGKEVESAKEPAPADA